MIFTHETGKGCDEVAAVGQDATEVVSRRSRTSNVQCKSTVKRMLCVVVRCVPEKAAR